MERRFSFVITVISVVLVAYGILIYVKVGDDKICDELVIMNDGSQIEASEVDTYENGMSRIHQCNGEDVRIPTVNIKMIKKIKSIEQ